MAQIRALRLQREQAAPLVKGNLVRPNRMLSVDVRRKTDSSVCLTKVQIWQASSPQSGGLQLAKSEGRMAVPATCWIDTWK